MNRSNLKRNVPIKGLARTGKGRGEAGKVLQRRSQVERTASSRRIILDAAQKSFNRLGFCSTSMEEVSRLAGVSKGLVLYHFNSKESLLIEVVRDLYRRVAEEVQAVTIETGPSLEQAAWALDRLWSSVRQFQPIMPLIIDLVSQSITNKRLKKQLKPLYEELRGWLVGGIEVVLGPVAYKHFPVNAQGLAEITMAMMMGLWTNYLISDNLSRTETGFTDYKKLILAISSLDKTADRG